MRLYNKEEHDTLRDVACKRYNFFVFRGMLPVSLIYHPKVHAKATKYRSDEAAKRSRQKDRHNSDQIIYQRRRAID